jgi:hypothetical protein
MGDDPDSPTLDYRSLQADPHPGTGALAMSSLLLPVGVWIAYLIVSRTIRLNHRIAWDWTFFLTSIASGVALFGHNKRSWRASRLLAFAAGQAALLLLLSLLLVWHLEIP